MWLVMWLHDITIAFLLGHKLWQACKCLRSWLCLIKKKPPTPSRRLRRKSCMFNWWKNLLNSMRKREKKTGGLINEKPPKLNKETRRKTDLQGVKNLQNLTRKTRRKTGRCARLSSSGRYAEEELRDPCIGEKPPNPMGNWGEKPKD